MATRQISLINATVTCTDTPPIGIPLGAQCVRCNRHLSAAVHITTDANPNVTFWTCGPCAFSMFGFRSELRNYD